MSYEHWNQRIGENLSMTAGLRTIWLEGYQRSKGTRGRIDEVFGWVKTLASGRELRYCVAEPNRFRMEMATASSNLGGRAKFALVPE